MKAARWLVLMLCLAACGGAGEEGGEEEASERPRDGVVRIEPEALARAELRTTPVVRAALDGARAHPADVRTVPTRTAHLSAVVPGRVAEISVLVGDAVARGQTLVLLDSAAAADLGASLGEARARLRAADAAVDRLAALGETGIASQRARVEAEAERDRARALVGGLARQRGVVGARGSGGMALVAPWDGVVLEVAIRPGDVVSPGDLAIVIADTSQLWIAAEIPERASEGVTSGMAASFRPTRDPAALVSAAIARIAPALHPHRRTLEVIVEVEGASLRPGETGTLVLGAADTLVVPSSALVRLDDTDAVFVPAPDGAYRAVHVEAGRSARGLTEIRSGLEEGTLVVERGAFTLLGVLLRGEIGEE